MTILEFLTAAEAYAAAEAEHAAPSINDLWFPLINFLIYAYIIVKFAVPPIRDFLRSRREEVVGKITRASAKKQAAQALVEEYRAKLAGLDTEVRSLHASLREEGEQEKTKLLSEAQARAVKITEDGRFLADQEVKMARQKLREEMAEEAEATARQLVERNLSDADQSRLVNDFVQTIGQPR